MKFLLTNISIISILMILSCQRKDPEFHLTGHGFVGHDDKQVVLSQFRNNLMFRSDTATIRNGNFYFTGDELSDGTATLAIIDNDSVVEYVTELILEKGKIEISTDSENKIKGGRLNALFQDFMKIRFMTDSVSEMIYANLHNPIGLILMQKYIYVLPDSTLDVMLDVGGKTLRDNITIQDALAERKEYELINKMRNELIGTQSKDWMLLTADGLQKNLSDYIGLRPYTYLSFWASWCGPCIAEIPQLREIIEKYKQVTLVSISVDRDREEWLNSLRKHDMPGINLHPLSVQGINDYYHIFTIPYGILIDGNGHISDVSVGIDKLTLLLKN